VNLSLFRVALSVKRFHGMRFGYPTRCVCVCVCRWCIIAKRIELVFWCGCYHRGQLLCIRWQFGSSRKGKPPKRWVLDFKNCRFMLIHCWPSHFCNPTDPTLTLILLTPLLTLTLTEQSRGNVRGGNCPGGRTAHFPVVLVRLHYITLH